MIFTNKEEKLKLYGKTALTVIMYNNF